MSIKKKIEAVGTPLKDWNIQINYGIKTGYNEAFIINTEKRNEILNNCIDEAERKRTEEIIRPILRGKDIKRYSYKWAELWLINTHNGIKGKIPRIKIEDYPAIKAHLDSFKEILYDRADQGDTPYNLRNCAYLEEFSKPKIVWPRLMRLNLSDLDFFPRFCSAPKGMYVVDSLCFITGKSIDYLISVLNSEYAAYYFFNNVATLDNGGFQMRQQYVENIPIPPISEKDPIQSFGFTIEEIDYITSFVQKIKNEIANGR